MQTDKLSNSRIFIASSVDCKDDFEEKFERFRAALLRYGGNGSEKETHDALTAAAHRDRETHNEICLGLLGYILLDKETGAKYYRDLTLLSRDNLLVVVENLTYMSEHKYHKLTDVARGQFLWITREMVKGSVTDIDRVCWNLMRQMAGGDISGRNLWLIEYMLDVFIENRSTWLKKYPGLIAGVIYNYLRILEDHTSPSLAGLKQKEVTLVVGLIREHFTEVVINHQVGMGRDFLRLLQSVARIPEIQELWTDLYYNPRSLSPHFTSISQIFNSRTSRKYFASRLTPEMEKKINFLCFQVKFGTQKRYQDWFQKQYFSTQESQTLRTDIIRYIVCCLHPPNEILCSDILPRWAIIGFLLSTCTNQVTAANAKLALLYDWLVFDPLKDNIMNIEPAILVMYHSLKSHLSITATLFDFLIRLTIEFWPRELDRIKTGVGAALRTILEKRVIPSLDPVLENSKLEPELKKAVKETLLVLVDDRYASSSNNSTGPQLNNLVENHFNHGNSNNLLGGILPIVTHRASPPPSLIPNNISATPSNCLFDAVSSNLNNTATNNNHGTVIKISTPKPIPQQQLHHQVSIPVPPSQPPSQPEPDFSDEDDDDEAMEVTPIISTEISPVPTPKPKISAALPFLSGISNRNSPTLGSSAEETERNNIFEKISALPTNMRLPFESMLNNTMKMGNGSDLLDEVLSALVDEPIEKEARENVSKCLLYIYKSEMNKPCFNEETNSVIENLCISPVSELLSMVIGLKPADKSTKMKNVMRVLSDLTIFHPSTGYKILILLNQMFEKDPKYEDLKGSRNNYEQLYRNLWQLRGLKFEPMLYHDLKICFEREPGLIAYMYLIVYIWYVDDAALINSSELLKYLVSSLDPVQLQTLVWNVMQENVIFIDEEAIVEVLLKSLEWETWEQHCIWTLVSAHTDIKIEDLVPIIPHLDAKKNSEALTALLLILRRETPTTDIVSTLFCRRPSSKDSFVVSILKCWVNSLQDDLAEVLASVLIKASGGSPTKRKRGPTGSRGTASPAGTPSPSTENVLAHLDSLRLVPPGDEIFDKDIMVAALSQVQSWVTDSQRNKYKDLLSIAVEDPEDKESRPSSGSNRRSTSYSKRLPASPTSSNKSSPTTAPTNERNSSASNALPRTRSGKTRSPVKQDSSSSDDSEEDIPRPKKAKRRRNISSIHSDSD